MKLMVHQGEGVLILVRRMLHGRRWLPAVRAFLIIAFAVIFLTTFVITQLSALGIYVISMGPSSATFGIKTHAENSGIAAFSGASFQLYADNRYILNGSAYVFYPSAGSKSIDTFEFSVPYSTVGSLLWPLLFNGGGADYKLTGRATFITPLGIAELPLNISLVPNRISSSPSSARLEASTAVSNDPTIAAFSSAKVDFYVNDVYVLNLTSINPIPVGNIPPKLTMGTTEISVPYSQLGTLQWSILQNWERVKLAINGSAIFQSYITVSGMPVGEVGIPLTMSIITDSYGNLPVDLDFTLVLLALLVYLLYGKVTLEQNPS